MSGMTGLRKAQKEMTRRLLLSAALGLFQEKGYARTTIDEIAAAAGTTRVTFYAYFPSRAELMKALIGELNELLDRTPSPEHGSTERALVGVVADGDPAKIAHWLREASKRWDAIGPYTRAAFEAAATDPEIRVLVDKWFGEGISDIQEGLEAAGRFPPESRRLRAAMAMTHLDYVERTWTPSHTTADLDSILDVLATSWIALLAEPRP